VLRVVTSINSIRNFGKINYAWPIDSPERNVQYIDLENMSLRSSLRRVAPVARQAFVASRSSFHTTPRAFVKVGDTIPNLEVLHEDTPGTKVNLAEEFKSADGYIVGVPAAFSGTCSSMHVPSYINSPKLKNAGKVFVVSVNDVFV
jgi:Redoxin